MAESLVLPLVFISTRLNIEKKHKYLRLLLKSSKVFLRENPVIDDCLVESIYVVQQLKGFM